MVLKINNEIIEDFSSFEDLLTNYPDLAESSSNWKNSEIKTVYKHDRFVYIGQREMGILDPSDSIINIIGSEDATTCHIVILKNLTTQNYGIIHIDSHRENQLQKLALAMDQNIEIDSETQNNVNTEFEVYIVGGYNDEKDTSRKITRAVMDYIMYEQTKTFYLRLACAGFINTRTVENLENEVLNYPAPIHYGVAVNANSGLIFPAKFISHGPDKDIRMLKSNVTLVYNSKEGKICVPVFDYDSCSSATIWIQVNDDIILSNLSTSPKVEPRHFCDDMRNMFKRMVTDPNPQETLFKNNSDRYYSLNNETLDWELDNPELYGSNHTKDKQQFSLKDFIRTAKKI